VTDSSTNAQAAATERGLEIASHR